MTFPNAYKGVKKIFIAEILTIIAVVIMTVSGVVALALLQLIQQDEGAAGGALASLITFILGTCLTIPAFIIYLVGILQAKKDEQHFYYAFVFVILPIIASVFAAIFSQYELVQNIAEIVRNICEVIAMIMIIGGIKELAAKLNSEQMVSSANTALRIISGVYILLIIARVIEFVFDFLPAMVTFGGIVALAAGVLNVIAHVYYLVLLGRSIKMLKE